MVGSAFESDFADNLAELVDCFGESVSYTPQGGSAKQIVAIIDRHERDEMGPSGLRVEQSFGLWVMRSDIDSARVGDTVSLRKRAGDSADTTMRVVRVMDQIGAGWHLVVQ